jgi:hypothetical protein
MSESERVTHEAVAVHWYAEDHDECESLRQGDIFAGFLENGWDYLVVVSRSCNLRDSPTHMVEFARADELETYLAENGQEIGSVDAWIDRAYSDRFMLPRRPGAFETELIVNLHWQQQVPADRVCKAVEAGMVRARASAVLSGVVAYQVGMFYAKPSIIVEIPKWRWEKGKSRVPVAPFVPGSAPYSTSAIPLLANHYVAAAGTPREGEEWFRVWIEGHDLISSTTPNLDASRREVAELIMDLKARLEGDTLDPNRGTTKSISRIVGDYFA